MVPKNPAIHPSTDRRNYAAKGSPYSFSKKICSNQPMSASAASGLLRTARTPSLAARSKLGLVSLETMIAGVVTPRARIIEIKSNPDMPES